MAIDEYGFGFDDESGDSVPSYLIAANNHNFGNNNPSMFGGGEKRSLGNRIYNMVGSAAVSGINSFYNTALWAGNWFSDEGVQYRDAKDVIASFDEDMAQYYDQNRQAADLLGLVTTSFIPGLGGVKVFQGGMKALGAAKGGTIGANMSKGLGILPGSRDALIKEAAQTFATSKLPFSYRNPATVKAITAGFGQNALETLAFETAVAVTMKKNPILTDLDFGQTVSNIAWGGALGGAIGGTLAGVGAVWKIKKYTKDVDLKLAKAGVSQLDQGVAGTRASDSLLIIRNDLDTVWPNAPEGVDAAMYTRALEDKHKIADNRSNELMTTLAGGDAEVGTHLWRGIATDNTTELSAKLLGLEEVTPLGKLGELTKKAKYRLEEPKLPKLAKKDERVWFTEGKPGGSLTRTDEHTHWVDVPKGSIDPTNITIPEGAAANKIHTPKHVMRYLKLWGDDMGKISDEAPKARHLADLGKVVVHANGVEVGKDFIKHRTGLVDMTTLSYDEALARNIWAMDNSVPRLREQLSDKVGYIDIHENDTAMLTKAYREGLTEVRVIGADGTVLVQGAEKKQLLQFLAGKKDELTQAAMIKAVQEGSEETAEHIANRFDTPLGFITGEQYSANMEDAVMAMMGVQKKWYQKYHANTTRPPQLEDVTPWKMPQNYAMVYDVSSVNSLDGFQIDMMATIRARQEIYKAAANNAAMDTLGNKYELLPEISEAQLQGVNRAGAGPGMASYSNAPLGAIDQLFELIGSLVTKWSTEAATKISNTFTSANYAVLNSPEAMTELAAVMHKVRAAGNMRYVIDAEGGGLILKATRDYEAKLAAGHKNLVPPEIPSHIDEFIPIDSGEVLKWLQVHVETNSKRMKHRNDLRAAQGYDSNWDAEVVYAPAPNPDRFTHHAFVVDSNKIVSQGDTTMLYAPDARALELQIAEARANGFEVYTPKETADYYRARGLYEHSLSMNEWKFDASMRATGSSAPAFPITGSPQEMLQDWMQWHAREEGNLIREAVETKYFREFGIIRQMGKEYDNVAKATRGVLSQIKAGSVENPYNRYIKLAFGASLKENFPVWTTLNDFIETVGNKAYNAISGIWRNGVSTAEQIEQINATFKKFGIAMPATEAQMEAWVNHPAGKKVVTEFIQTQNAILSSLVLRLDPINALNNAISSPILTLTEAGSWIRKIANGDPGFAEYLSKKIDIEVPGTGGDKVRSATKLMGEAYAAYWGPNSAELLNRYRALNVVSDYSDQIRNLMELATIKGTETAAELTSRKAKLIELGNKLVDKGTTWTGNKHAEELNRFVSAYIADQLTAPMVASGKMTPQVQGAFINTFVNRTQGNIIASQRPQMFQGPLGQAIGLFQSYQFNIMQQLLRYVGEGSKKDALMLMGLQGSIFGLNGLPAFQAINQHIIGTASGNTNHVDAYTSVNNLVGHSVGNWLMYGAASNMLLDPDLKINLYSRGDISPRQLSIVPTEFAQIPVVGAWTKVYGALKQSVGSLNNGGDVWNTLLGGIEQQGLNRPLAGLARVARGITNDGVSFSASRNGNIISANDVYTLASLARLSGAKPLEEAIAQDAQFRINAYQAKDNARRQSLGYAIRTVIAGGGEPTEQQMQQFQQEYMKSGGKQEEFIKWYMQQLRAATTPQVNKLIDSNRGFSSEYMQNIMGGRLLATPEDIKARREQ